MRCLSQYQTFVLPPLQRVLAACGFTAHLQTRQLVQREDGHAAGGGGGADNEYGVLTIAPLPSLAAALEIEQYMANRLRACDDMAFAWASEYLHFLMVLVGSVFSVEALLGGGGEGGTGGGRTGGGGGGGGGGGVGRSRARPRMQTRCVSLYYRLYYPRDVARARGAW